MPRSLTNIITAFFLLWVGVVVGQVRNATDKPAITEKRMIDGGAYK